MPNVSVIVPVYKSELYVSRCIESIQQQDYADFELILIDDGSPDRSGEICDEYAEKDQRIKVIHKPNGGVSSARNAGLDAATGEYIVFVDSDDYVLETYLSDLLIDEYDIVVAGHIVEQYNGTRNYVTFPNVSAEVIKYGEINQYRALHDYHICSKLYKAAIIEKNNIRFETKYSLGEDAVFFSQYLKYCNSFVTIGKTPYVYVRYGSFTSLSTTITPNFLYSYEQTNRIVHDNMYEVFGVANDYLDVVKSKFVSCFMVLLGDRHSSMKQKWDNFRFLYSNHLFCESIDKREFEFRNISDKLYFFRKLQ